VKNRGILIAEAVVASFLMLFAFAAAAALFDAALRWESDSGNYRKAALVAERKMEELRAEASDISSGDNFANHIDSLIAGPHADYPDAPGFSITVTPLDNVHRTITANGRTPGDGVHSPCSSFFTDPAPVGLPHPFDPTGDHQLNQIYHTYPYSRPMPRSYRLVQVSVAYGGGTNPRTFELVSLIGDPLMPPNPTVPNVNNSVVVSRVGPNSDISSASPSATYTVSVVTNSGAIVEEVSALWNITPRSTGSGDLFTLDPNGTSCRLDLGPAPYAGTEISLAARVRYRGVEAIGVSAPVGVNP
jgi:hypothetical protein